MVFKGETLGRSLEIDKVIKMKILFKNKTVLLHLNNYGIKININQKTQYMFVPSLLSSDALHHFSTLPTRRTQHLHLGPQNHKPKQNYFLYNLHSLQYCIINKRKGINIQPVEKFVILRGKIVLPRKFHLTSQMYLKLISRFHKNHHKYYGKIPCFHDTFSVPYKKEKKNLGRSNNSPICFKISI